MRVSAYERLQIASLLGEEVSAEEGVGLYLMPEDPRFGEAYSVFEAAVLPAMRKNSINVREVAVSFNSDSLLAEVGRAVRSAQVIVAHVHAANADLMYVLGLCHGLGRCPILIGERPLELPFNLGALRCVEYGKGAEGVYELREELTRGIRVFLGAGRGS
jgi:hypothetical protein